LPGYSCTTLASRSPRALRGALRREVPAAQTYDDLPRGVFSSNPFDFMQFRTLLRNGVPPTPFPSITSALFSMQRRVEGISCPSARGSSLAPRHCKPCVCHTSERSPANPFICHTSKNGPPQVPCLPHLRYPPAGLYTSFFPDSGPRPTAESQARGMLVFGTELRITSHPSVPLHARWRGATIGLNDGSTGKQSCFFRCLRKRADSGFGKRSTPCPASGRP